MVLIVKLSNITSLSLIKLCKCDLFIENVSYKIIYA